MVILYFMMLLNLLIVVNSRYSFSCGKGMHVFVLKSIPLFNLDLPNIEFCQDPQQEQDLIRKINKNEDIKSIQRDIDESEPQYPFSFQPLDVSIYANINELHNTGGLNDMQQNTTITRTNQLKVTKEISLKNILPKEILITNIYSSSPNLKAQFDQIELFPNKKQKTFTVIYQQMLSELQSQTFSIYLAIEIQYSIRVPLKMIIYDKSLLCQTTIKQECSRKGQHREIKFGSIGLYQQYHQNFQLHNPNPIKIDVNFRQLDNKYNSVRVLLQNKEQLKAAFKRKFAFEIKAFQTVNLVIVLNSNYLEKGKRELTFKTPYEYIDLQIDYDVTQASVSFYPSMLTPDHQHTNSLQKINMMTRVTYTASLDLLGLDKNQTHQKNSQFLYFTLIRTSQLLQFIPVILLVVNLLYLIESSRKVIKQQQSLTYTNKYTVPFGKTRCLNTLFNTNASNQLIAYQQTNHSNDDANRSQVCNGSQLTTNALEYHNQSDSHFETKSENSEVSSQDFSQSAIIPNESQDKLFRSDIGYDDFVEKQFHSKEQSSSTFSEGESISDVECPRGISDNYEAQSKLKQQSQTKSDQFNLFEKIQFSIPVQQLKKEHEDVPNVNSNWSSKYPIFYFPQKDSDSDSDYDEQMIKNNFLQTDCFSYKNQNQKLQKLKYQYQKQLPQFQISELEFPFPKHQQQQQHSYQQFQQRQNQQRGVALNQSQSSRQMNQQLQTQLQLIESLNNSSSSIRFHQKPPGILNE